MVKTKKKTPNHSKIRQEQKIYIIILIFSITI
jgi:hypothetical protein